MQPVSTQPVSTSTSPITQAVIEKVEESVELQGQNAPVLPVDKSAQDPEKAQGTREEVAQQEATARARIEAEMNQTERAEEAKGASAEELALINEKTGTVVQQFTQKIVFNMMMLNLGQGPLLRKAFDIQVADFDETANREEKTVLQHLTTALTSVIGQLQLSEESNQLQRKLSYENAEDLLKAFLVPVVKEYTAEIKEISPVFVAGLCKVYGDKEASSTLDALGKVLAVLDSIKRSEQPLSDEQIDIISALLEAEDKKRALAEQEKSLPEALYRALESFFNTSIQEGGFETIRQQLTEMRSSNKDV